MTGPAGALDQDVLRSLAFTYVNQWSASVRELLLAPAAHGTAHTLEDARETLRRVVPADLLSSLVPLAVVDEASLACAVLKPLSDGDRTLAPGTVVRLFLGDVPPSRQLALLDVDPLLYIASLEEELSAREAGLTRMLDEIGPAYERAFIDHDRRPRDFVVRPVRLACQNVVVGYAAIAQDSAFDGLSVPAWMTAEVPHVATHEANRALAALMLCDAFARGGTIEVRFDRPASVHLDGRTIRYAGHPEGRVPAGLRRYGRTRGVPLGADDPASISPAEARELFLAVTPMPRGLRERVRSAVATDGIGPERVCYALLSQVWRELELELLLATSEQGASVLAGGADWTHRSLRQAESDVCRAALMAGMYFRRLNGRDSAGATDGVRIAEDVSAGVTWTVHEDTAAVEYHMPDPVIPPWSAHDSALPAARSLTVLPRVHVSDRDRAVVRALRTRGTAGALLLPQDTRLPFEADVPVLRCPDRLADLDRAIEEKLLTSRLARG
ncbi:hypothetical protein ABZ464_20120 [Streptomyces sp. NPDC005820]|uniref:hypothetical protein n=1 Tax=Streptomyces sp. NPDC005820 TaxID=3157069 RepID=UPI0034040C65